MRIIKENLLSHHRTENGERITILNPFIYIRLNDAVEDGTYKVVAIPLQFIKQNLNLNYMPYGPHNYLSANSTEVYHEGKQWIVPLILADNPNPEWVRIEYKFGDGVLFGYFPPHLANI